MSQVGVRDEMRGVRPGTGRLDSKIHPAVPRSAGTRQSKKPVSSSSLLAREKFTFPSSISSYFDLFRAISGYFDLFRAISTYRFELFELNFELFRLIPGYSGIKKFLPLKTL
jgi:hypothetical protein